MRFKNRVDAGRQLARKLDHLKGRPDLLVLGLPRGGVPVAAEVARHLHAPLDVFLVRKLGLPNYEELAMGAIALGGIRVLNPEVVNGMGLTDGVIDQVTAREELELRRRAQIYRGHEQAPQIEDRTIVLIDDGIATGSSMRAAIEAIKGQHPAALIVAVPTCAPETCQELKSEVDEVVSLMMPRDFSAVGQWYDDFSQTTDEEVIQSLQAGTVLK